ncbi:hypothetical protein D3273_14370 [Lichenibacterium minor]|uniref:Uncharacterized protein n=1 Tax=Lichenibacterium minor TaxID=2316528 RepID=A0A4Q2U432_9HYPH|nr:hypothetical protein [Lichenibacterium minor]RYC31299.1 hypothetical protein D3273_14370 [Lichenibacterium minor]
MTTFKIAAAAALVLLPLAAVPMPALAASAHNSRLGADGPVSNNSAPTGMAARAKAMRQHKVR